MRYLDNGKIIVDNAIELRDIVEKKEIPLELIDIKESGLTHLSMIFMNINEINGSISDWDISNIEKLSYTFLASSLNPDLSKWNTSNVISTYSMFTRSNFNNDSLKNWDLSNLLIADFMFYESKFCGDISNWKFNKDDFCTFSDVFKGNKNFKNKYNSGKDIPHDTNDFLEWFENNREKMKNIDQGSKEEILDFFSFDNNSFELVK